jgi:Kef-type K+ transport system membrane component KefB
MHFVLGPFVAGLFFDGAHVGDAAFARTKHVIGALTLGFLGPIFFASIGLRLDPGAIATIPGFLAALILIAFAGKLIGAGLPAYWAGLDRRHALAVGVGMSGRGAMELVVASIAEKAGVFASADGPDPIVGNLFSALVLTAVITTLLTPVLLRWVLADRTTD